MPTSLRADALANRRAVVEAARELFATQGLGVSSNEIARRAGVGIATLLRRFPTRESLLAAAYADRMAEHVRIVEDGLASENAWEGFVAAMRGMCRMQLRDRGFAEFMAQVNADDPQVAELRRRSHDGIAELIDRAKAQGRMRPDVVLEDIALVLMANAGVVAVTRSTAPDAWERLVGLLLRSFDATGTQPLPDAPSPEPLGRAMTASATTTGGTP